MRIIVSNIIEIQNPSQIVLKWVKETLTIKNPEYSKKVRLGFWTGNTPKFIKLYDCYSDKVYIPVGCLENIKILLTNEDTIYDVRSEVSANIKSHIVLRDYQKPSLTPFISRFHSHTNGLIIAGCGLGKTNMGLEIASQLNQKTLFITHTLDLCKQAETRCKDNMECKTSLITEGKVDLSGDIVFATVQTLIKNLDSISPDTFGLIITDECHKICCSPSAIGMFRQSIEHFAAKYKIGLTATLYRSDGLHMCIPRIVGNILYEIKDEGANYVGYLDEKPVISFDKSQFQVPAKVTFIETGYKIKEIVAGKIIYHDVFDTNEVINFSKLMNDLCGNDKRNNLIAKYVLRTKGSSIILSDRVEQLKTLYKMIPNSVLITGTTKKQDREQALKDVGEGRVQCLIASYKIAKEGLDLPILENLFMASPVKDDAVVVQSIGRIQRPFGNKQIANVFDFTDNEVSTLERFYRKRKSIYKKRSWL